MLGTIPSQGCQLSLLQHFGTKMSSLSPSVLKIEFCPNMDMGVAVLGFFADFWNLVCPPNSFGMMSSNYFK